MTEQAFILRVDEMARRLEVQPPKVKIAPGRGRDGLRVRVTGWVLRATPRTLTELSDAEIEFAIAHAMIARIEPGQRKPHLVAAPFAALTFIGVIILVFGQQRFLENFYLGYGILFGLMVVGYVAGMFVSIAVEEAARSRVIGEALNMTGNASAAETYLIRSKTDHLLTGRRRLGAPDRDQLNQQLDALKDAARRLGLSYYPVGMSD